jgi:hypothetical protein
MSRKHVVTAVVALAVGIVTGVSGTAWTQGRHPHIVSAQKSLTAAEKHLQEAVHHYGGHRARALELTQQARAELREALEYARTHAGEFK